MKKLLVLLSVVLFLIGCSSNNGGNKKLPERYTTAERTFVLTENNNYCIASVIKFEYEGKVYLMFKSSNGSIYVMENPNDKR